MPAKRFVFRLQTVLELKIKKEDEEKKKLGDLIAWQKQEEQILAQLVATEQSTRAYLKEKQATGQWIEVDELKRISYYLKKVAGEIEAQKQKLIEIARRIEEQRDALLAAVKEKKTLETLKENQHQEWLREVEEEEAKVLDELATLKYAREGYGNEE
ncbi:MAG: flagellar export protein FliJ [Proteobacteria bacterium]|nr:flagellar export protein FliJ [Pseudomonadota bacterium]